MSKQIVCPSGLKGTIRGLKGKEAKLLTDRNAVKNGTLFDQILSSCWERTEEAPAYSVAPGVPLDWGKVLQGDRFYTLLQIRSLTYGPSLEFNVQCSEENCRHKFVWEVDLNDLPVKPLSEEDVAGYRSGNRFEAVIPSSGKKAYFGLRTGEDEVKAMKQLKGQAPDVVTALLFRVHEFEGVPASSRRGFAEDLELGDINSLMNQFDEHDCGVETSIEIECPSCMNTQETQLPFDRQFWMPKSLKK